MAAGRAAIAAGAVDAGIACLRRAVAESAAADDIILQIGDALIFDRSDLWLFTREHEAGTEFDVVYVRDRALARGRAASARRCDGRGPTPNAAATVAVATPAMTSGAGTTPRADARHPRSQRPTT